MAHVARTVRLTKDQIDAMLAANDINLRAELRRLRSRITSPEEWLEPSESAGLYGERSAKECDGNNFHNIKVDFISFIEHPDEIWRKYASGTTGEVRSLIESLHAERNPAVEIFVDYCCEKLKQVRQ